MTTNSVHPTAIIGVGAELGDGNVIGPYVVISSGARLGNENWIGAHAVVGAPPEHRAHRHPARSGLHGEHGDEGCVIGDGNIIREFVVVQSGRLAATRIENDCFLMAHSYVAHDSHAEQAATLSASVALAGHVRVGAGANLGVGSSVRQGIEIGPGVMIGMGAVVVRDVPAFMTVLGIPARSHGINRVGLERVGLRSDEIAEIEMLIRSREMPQHSSSAEDCGRLRDVEARYRSALKNAAPLRGPHAST